MAWEEREDRLGEEDTLAQDIWAGVDKVEEVDRAGDRAVVVVVDSWEEEDRAEVVDS